MATVQLDFRIPDTLPESLPVLPLRRGTLLPGGVVPFTVGRKVSLEALDQVQDGLLLVVPQREPNRDVSPSDLLTTGTLARVLNTNSGERGKQLLVQGLARVELTGFPTVRPYLEARFVRVDETWPDNAEADGLRLAFVEAVRETATLLGGEERVAGFLRPEFPITMLVDVTAQLVDAPEDWRRDVLTTHDPLVRAEKVLERISRVREAISAKKAVEDRVHEANRETQREFLLRQQLKAIQSELGEGDDDELSGLQQRLEAADLPDEVQKVVDRELSRLERLGSSSPERSVAIDWLSWVADMPWNDESGVDVDLTALEQALDKSHFGLEDVKRQVVEYLAVRQLAGAGRADVLLLVGPPGVGKTSIGQAIADATGRKLVRVALGGVHDEAELRGHRRTYIGARPGRLVEGIRRAGTSDPVVLLDEVDKLGNSHRGSPASALLEILDPEQNHAFTDHYLEVPFDLSKALFVATANDLSAIPGPLRDRMEILQLDGYTRDQKLKIARSHLLEKVAANAGVEVDSVRISDEALSELIAGWTREAGVRTLQRVVGRLYRAAAVLQARGELHEPLTVEVEDLPKYLDRRKFHDEQREAVQRPGIATGLAWTPVGGDVLYVEASTLPGNGKLILTGQLGDVMKESARAALTWVLAHAERLGIDPTVMERNDLHIHVPAGSVPKDGPSAGVTMTVALSSLLTGRAVRADTAMTGEATLRGRVLPVGGITAKVLAAHRHGVTRVMLPRRNGDDFAEVPEQARNELELVLLDDLYQAVDAALEPHKAVSASEAA